MKLETDHGVYEADTEKELLRLVRSGAKKHREKERQEAAARAQARMLAEAMAYRILFRLLDGERVSGQKFQPGWRFHKPGEPYASARVTETRVTASYKPWPTVAFECEGGRAEPDFYGQAFIGSVENGAGFCIAFFLQEQERGESGHLPPVQGYAVAVHDGIAAWVPLPGITPHQFAHKEAATDA